MSLYTVAILRVTPDTSRQYNTGFTGEFNILDSNRVYQNMDAYDHTHWERELKCLPVTPLRRELAWRRLRLD